MKDLTPSPSASEAAPLAPTAGAKKPPKRKIISATLARTFERALQVHPDQIREYQPAQSDLEILEAMLAGATNQVEIVAFAGVSAETVKQALKNNLTCAWLSHQLHTLIRTRLGMIDAAMMNRALHGDVAAANLMYKRYDQLTERKEVKHVQDFDVSVLSDDELHKLATQSAKKLAIDVEYETTATADPDPTTTT